MPPQAALLTSPEVLPGLPGDFASLMADDPDRGLRLLLLTVQERAALYFELQAKHDALVRWAREVSR